MKKFIVIAAALSIFLIGCTAHSDLQAWIDEEQQKAQSNTRAPENFDPPEFDVYNPAPFVGLDAFDPERLKATRLASKSINAPDMARKKEILEKYDLGRLRYVGSIKNNNEWRAFIQVDNLTYTVTVGNYLGTDFGRIVAIAPEKILLQETVQNIEDEWIYRSTELPLVSTK